jgi:hypothetical protein
LLRLRVERWCLLASVLTFLRMMVRSVCSVWCNNTVMPPPIQLMPAHAPSFSTKSVEFSLYRSARVPTLESPFCRYCASPPDLSRTFVTFAFCLVGPNYYGRSVSAKSNPLCDWNERLTDGIIVAFIFVHRVHVADFFMLLNCGRLISPCVYCRARARTSSLRFIPLWEPILTTESCLLSEMRC